MVVQHALAPLYLSRGSIQDLVVPMDDYVTATIAQNSLYFIGLVSRYPPCVSLKTGGRAACPKRVNPTDWD
jgi:hypothetical protein